MRIDVHVIDTPGLGDRSYLATDGQVRPFSTGRRGLLLGDGGGAVVLEAAGAAGDRGIVALAVLAGWGRAGDAYHPCQPAPDGRGPLPDWHLCARRRPQIRRREQACDGDPASVHPAGGTGLD